MRYDHRIVPLAPAFVPGIDGLRGLAILGVLLFHVQIAHLSLGWTGVELFFVISGFLITRILLANRDKPYYFRNFYVRRSLRIFPIYYLVIAIYFGVCAFQKDFHTLKVMPFYLVYLQTIPQLTSNLTDAPMLIHTWTLAIEEQFYFLWPLAVLFLRGRQFVIALVALCAISLALRFATLGFDSPYLILGWLPVQLDSLAAGALLAFAASEVSGERFQRGSGIAFLAGAAALGLIVAKTGLWVYWTPATWSHLPTSPLLLTALACTFAGIIGLTASDHPLTRWLSFPPLARYGKVSYGIYLFHPYVFSLLDSLWDDYRRHHLPFHFARGLMLIAKLGLSYAVAKLSWAAIENPINRLKDRFTMRPKDPMPKRAVAA
jgi:peptidoglycan/LPS O-acetylase OafA/YrhL